MCSSLYELTEDACEEALRIVAVLVSTCKFLNSYCWFVKIIAVQYLFGEKHRYLGGFFASLPPCIVCLLRFFLFLFPLVTEIYQCNSFEYKNVDNISDCNFFCSI